ncbi:MAG: transposase [Bacteroidota bacterium]
MSRKYKFRDQNRHYFVTLTVTKWIDIFIRDKYKDILIDSFKHCQKNKGLEIYSYCIMTSHVHMIVGTIGDTFSQIFRDMKKFTSKKIKKEITQSNEESRKDWLLKLLRNKNTNSFELWQEGSHPIELNSLYMMEQKLDYIHENPVVAGFVNKAEDWIYSSASDYCNNKKGLLDITWAN